MSNEQVSNIESDVDEPGPTARSETRRDDPTASAWLGTLESDVAQIKELQAAALRNDVSAERNLIFRTAAEIAATTAEDVQWIAQPWVAAGSITEVVGKPKAAGKTTWVMRLVRAVLDGAAFLRRPTTRTPVVYLSEERSSTFKEALRRADLLDRTDLHVLEWRDTLSVAWKSIVEEAVWHCKRVGAQLLVIDTTSQFAGLSGDSENNAGDVLEAYQVLQRAAGEGVAVISIRHERKSGGDVANAGRGSSAFAGAVDIILAIRRPEGNTRDTIREIHGLSRFDETPDLLAIQLTDDGYIPLGGSGAVATLEAKSALLRVAPTSHPQAQPLEKLINSAGIQRTTAQAAIEELRAEGDLIRVGKGVKGDPYRYFAAPIHSAETPSSEEAERIGSSGEGETSVA